MAVATEEVVRHPQAQDAQAHLEDQVGVAVMQVVLVEQAILLQHPLLKVIAVVQEQLSVALAAVEVEQLEQVVMRQIPQMLLGTAVTERHHQSLVRL